MHLRLESKFAKDQITFTPSNEQLPFIIPAFDSPEKGGCIWLGFPGNAVMFGLGFSDVPLIRDKCRPFIEAVQRLDSIAIKSAFEGIRNIVQEELSIAKDISPTIEEILWDNARWGIEIFMANLGKNPVLINRNGKLFIEDETGAKFIENCYLVQLLPDGDGGINREDAISPLVLRSENDVTFAYYTNNVQEKMKRGNAVREAYNSGSAKCWVEFEVEKVGLFRKAIIKTPKVSFKEYS